MILMAEIKIVEQDHFPEINVRIAIVTDGKRYAFAKGEELPMYPHDYYGDGKIVWYDDYNSALDAYLETEEKILDYLDGKRVLI